MANLSASLPGFARRRVQAGEVPDVDALRRFLP
jgi:hypothetical protein